MRMVQRWGRAMAVAAALAMVCPQAALAGRLQDALADPASSGATLAGRDVILDADGLLRGTVVDRNGSPAAGMPLAVVHQGQTVAGQQTDAAGGFAIPGLKTGVYQLATPYRIETCRVWTQQAAPPAAQNRLLIVNGDQVIRGGMGAHGLIANPWVLGAIVAAAIAIPLSLDDDDDLPSGS